MSEQWRPTTPKPEKTFYCRHCRGSGFVPVCRVNGRGVAQVVSATCDCQAGQYQAEHLERTSMSFGEPVAARRFRLEDARRNELVPEHPREFMDYWYHAKIVEARHDMIRTGSDDDWKLRFLEAVRDGAKVDEWLAANPPKKRAEVSGFKNVRER